jgi:transcriptional regulator with XRE-family HTH domain
MEMISMADVATLVRSVRRSQRLTQSELSARSRVTQSRIALIEKSRENPRFDTVNRLLAGSGHRLYAAPTTRDDVVAIAADIRDAVRVDDLQLALRHLIQLNDNLVAEHGLVRGVLAVAEPESTGSKTWDAAIAALVAYRLNQERIPLPEWANDGSRALKRSRALRVDPADATPSPADVPQEFLDRGVLVWRDTLESV